MSGSCEGVAAYRTVPIHAGSPQRTGLVRSLGAEVEATWKRAKQMRRYLKLPLWSDWMTKQNPIRVTAAEYVRDYSIRLTFSDGSSKIVDFSRWIER